MKIGKFHRRTITMTAAVMVVMVMVVVEVEEVSAATPIHNEAEISRLRKLVDSHTESLLTINYYLKETDNFWTWFQANKMRLDEVLSADRSPQAPGSNWLLQRIEALEGREEERDDKIRVMWEDLQEEREKNRQLEARIQRLEEAKDTLSREIPQLEERMDWLEVGLTAVNRTTLANKRGIDGKVTSTLYELRQETNNLTALVAKSQWATSDEVNNLKSSIEGLVLGEIFPMQDQLRDLNETHLYLIEETNQEIIGVKRKINTLSSKISKKQGNSPNNQALQNQITRLQTNMSRIQGDISRLDARFTNFEYSGSHQDQVQQVRKEFAAAVDGLRMRLSGLEVASGNMDQEMNTTVTRIAELEKDVEALKQYSNITNHVRSIRFGSPSVTPTSRPPIGPPGLGFDSGFGRPGNQGWRGERGNPGSRGLPGIPGAPGNPGSRGEQGRPGAPGGPGLPGNPGNPGSRGEQGRPGAPGGPGLPGNAGARGNPGSRGLAGRPGPAGNPGLPGNIGAPGRQGAMGAPGGRGATGSSGSSGVRGPPGGPGLRGSAGSPGAPGRRGPAGSPGYPGSSGYGGSRNYASHRTSPAYAEYSATPVYGRYSSSSRGGGYY